jgi:hypothetical protein
MDLVALERPNIARGFRRGQHRRRVTRRSPRSRLACIGLALVTLVLGLASRRLTSALPRFVALYAGDALWAALVFWLAAAAWPRARTAHLAAGSLAFAVAIETSQLYHAPWIDAVRATRAGALVLGFGFLWSDLACYAAGVGFAAVLDLSITRLAAASASRRLRET